MLAQAATTTTTTTPPAADAKAKPKPLSTSDKTFVKKSAESLYLLSMLSDRVRGIERDGKVSGDISEISKKLGANGDVGKAWGEIGTVASNAGEMTLMPTELKGSDKTKSASLAKLKDAKFEKEFSEIVLKEAKDLVKAFESGAKMANNPELKAIAEKYLPTMQGIADDAAKAKAAHK